MFNGKKINTRYLVWNQPSRKKDGGGGGRGHDVGNGKITNDYNENRRFIVSERYGNRSRRTRRKEI